jgi:hypothetical protein
MPDPRSVDNQKLIKAAGLKAVIRFERLWCMTV